MNNLELNNISFGKSGHISHMDTLREIVLLKFAQCIQSI